MEPVGAAGSLTTGVSVPSGGPWSGGDTELAPSFEQRVQVMLQRMA